METHHIPTREEKAKLLEAYRYQKTYTPGADLRTRLSNAVDRFHKDTGISKNRAYKWLTSLVRDQVVIGLAILLLAGCQVDQVAPSYPPAYDYEISDTELKVYRGDFDAIIIWYAPEDYPYGCWDCGAEAWDPYRYGTWCNGYQVIDLDDRDYVRVFARYGNTLETIRDINQVHTLDELRKIKGF